jgi:hypothetical protein
MASAQVAEKAGPARANPTNKAHVVRNDIGQFPAACTRPPGVLVWIVVRIDATMTAAIVIADSDDPVKLGKPVLPMKLCQQEPNPATHFIKAKAASSGEIERQCQLPTTGKVYGTYPDSRPENGQARTVRTPNADDGLSIVLISL